MNRIHLLSEQVANQIAAGEVVERPASVVKELVENALDAQSARITVEIQAGGRSLIRVTDDGVGMSRDDALLCLERHATSKIQRAEDLAAVLTMGFRGEALPSIASVCRFLLTTRERDSELPEATQVVIHGGKMIEVKTAGAPSGTCVEARQLFFNLPARRKFLRTEETESAHIQHYLTLAAMSYPEVSFTFVRDGRMVWQLPAVKAATGADSLRERLRALQGGDLKLLKVDWAGELPRAVTRETEWEGERVEETDAPSSPIRVWGFIGAPGMSRATRDEQHLFVNRRPIENRGLNYALMEGYHTALMKGRYPVCCLFLELDPAAVDVNIHPAKREVKFHDERFVRQFVAQAIRQTLLRLQTGQAIAPATEVASPAPLPAPMRQMPLAAPDSPPLDVESEPLFNARIPASSGPSLNAETTPPFNAPSVSVVATREAHPSVPTPQSAAVPDAPPVSDMSASPAKSATPQQDAPVPLLQVPLRVLGVIGKLYVILESDRGLVLLDQHAAHERVLFEQMLQRMEKNTAPSQRLLLPETVELSARDADFLRQQTDTLNRLGVGLHEFGERTFLLDALPPFVKVSNPRAFVLGLVDELKEAGSAVNSLRLGEHTVAKTVCRHAVKAHDPLAGQELENLLHDLRLCAMPYTCPHGRPTLIEINYRELEKKFGRIQ